MYYDTLTDGSNVLRPISPANCTKLGPINSGFNEAACDIFQGAWCPTPRDCQDLVLCIRDTAEEVERSRDRRAFLEYLNGAPEVEDPEDPNACGELREYFDYDRDFPDDERICEEVRNLQVSLDAQMLFWNHLAIYSDRENVKSSALATSPTWMDLPRERPVLPEVARSLPLVKD